jgi:erythromycin esterase
MAGKRSRSLRKLTLGPVPKAALAALLLLNVVLCATRVTADPEPASQLHNIPASAYTDPAAYLFLRPLVTNRQIIGLAESLHMTAEFALVRIGIIKFLHEQMGFDVVAMEGSAVDFWISQDELLNSSVSKADVQTAQQRSFFGLWQSAEMRELLEYEASTLKTDHTLYLVSFDCQPGLRIQSVFKVLAARINKYSGRVSDSAWVSALEAIKDPGFPRDAEDKTRVLTAIDQMEQDIKSITAKVHKQFPSVAHAEALELLPQNLRNTVSLYGKRDQYSRQRDAINAGFISTMHDHLPSPGKLIVWAHHNHLTYGFSTAGMGRALHERWGNQMYSIGAFAESGQYYGFLDEETPAPADLSEPEPNTVDAYLAGLSNQNYFLDLSTLPEATNNPLFTRSTIRVEAKPWPATLAEDYDGIILIKKIHRPSFRAGFRLAILGMDAVFLLRTYWYVAFVLLVLLTVLIYRKLLAIRKRRLPARQRSLANP